MDVFYWNFWMQDYDGLSMKFYKCDNFIQYSLAKSLKLPTHLLKVCLCQKLSNFWANRLVGKSDCLLSSTSERARITAPNASAHPGGWTHRTKFNHLYTSTLKLCHKIAQALKQWMSGLQIIQSRCLLSSIKTFIFSIKT